MTSEQIRDPVADHLLTPQNSALIVIDYQPRQVHSINSMDRDLLSRNIVSVARTAKAYGALIRLTRDRGQWWYELSHRGWPEWFDIDLVAGAFGSKLSEPADRLSEVVGKFTEDRLLEPLRAYRDMSR